MKFIEIPTIIINGDWENPISQNMKVTVIMNNGEKFQGIFVGNFKDEITIEREDGTHYDYRADDINSIFNISFR